MDEKNGRLRRARYGPLKAWNRVIFIGVAYYDKFEKVSNGFWSDVKE